MAATLPDPVMAGSVQMQNCPASTTTSLGAGGGGAGDYIAGLLVVPTSVSPGTITVADGSSTAVTVFAGGTNGLAALVPFPIPLGAISQSGKWSVAVGAGMSVVALGKFT